jgi:peptidoglycan hydrolase-like protein with peptidoglycan-binding domain
VAQLQRALVEAGFLKRGDMDTGPGDYGPRTTAAVAALQAQAGIVGSDGKEYGPRTQRALQSALAAGPAPAPAPGPVATDGDAPTWTFGAEAFPGYRDARDEVAGKLDAVPGVWKAWGPLFEAVGADLQVDPHALAAYCMFESFNESMDNLNPTAMNGVAGGIAQTQSQYWHGKQVPGLDVYFPDGQEETRDALRAHPEWSARCLASIMKEKYANNGEISRRRSR